MIRGKRKVSRRGFMKETVAGAALLACGPAAALPAAPARGPALRLGGPTFEKYKDPDGWVKALKKLGYSAAYCPVGAQATDDVVNDLDSEMAILAGGDEAVEKISGVGILG